MADEEYEVEKVLRARVVKKGGRKSWLYEVKWKGYDNEEDNTWEPIESFDNGSEHFVETFWTRARETRDWTDLSAFATDEIIFPVGPPPKRRNLNKKPILTPRKPEAEPEVNRRRSSEKAITSSFHENPSLRGSKRRTIDIDGSNAIPAKKRKKGLETTGVPGSPQLKSRSVTTIETSKVSQRTPSTSSPQKKRRGPPGIRMGDPDNQAGPSSSRQQLPVSSPNVEDFNGPDIQSSDPLDISLHDSLFGSDNEVDATPVGPPKKRTTPRNPATFQKESNQLQAEAETIPIGPPKRTASKNAMPAHRARQANPRVKLIDDRILTEGYDGAISTKARFLSGTGAASSSANANARTLNGVVTGSTSLLTATKGKLRTVTGRERGLLADSSLQQNAQAVTANEMEDDHMVNDNIVTTTEIEQRPVSAPTGKELLNMAGYDAAEAQDLSDFEDGGGDMENAPKETAQRSSADATRENALSSKSDIPLESNTNGVASANPPDWRSSKVIAPISTIFGPLSFGRSVATDTNEGPSSSQKTLLSIKLDASATILTVLKDIQPPKNAAMKPLSEVISGRPGGPAGKFYRGDNATTLITTLRSEGSCARVVLDNDASDAQQRDFERFSTRLQAGELFVITIGSNVLALCSSGHQDLCTRLGMPPRLIGLGDSVLVTEVVIEDDGAFCDAVLRAEDERW